MKKKEIRKKIKKEAKKSKIELSKVERKELTKYIYLYKQEKCKKQHKVNIIISDKGRGYGRIIFVF